MAREHATIKLDIWADDDFRALPRDAQHLYFVLLTSSTLSYCGVGDWRPKRLAALAAGWTAGDVESAARVLAGRRYIVVDEDTEEVLIRSFVRNDGLMSRELMATAMAKAWSSVSSAVLRGVIVHELIRLHEEFPKLGGWQSDRAVDLLGKASVDPSTVAPVDLPVDDPVDPSVDPPIDPSVELLVDPSAMAQPVGPLELPVDLPPTTATTTATATSNAPTPLRGVGGVLSKIDSETITARSVVAAWVDANRENGADPSRAQIGQVAKLAGELLTRNDPGMVLAAAKSSGAKGYPQIDRELTVLAGRKKPDATPFAVWAEE